MNNLLIWPLSDTVKIVFSSTYATLANITCCDKIDFYFKVDQVEYPLALGLTGCQLSSFRKELLAIVNQSITEISLSESICISLSRLGHILVQVDHQKEVLGYFLVTLETIQAWITQLELLEVVMQENENEKKSRGTGCC
jgi:hypothetical protein